MKNKIITFCIIALFTGSTYAFDKVQTRSEITSRILSVLRAYDKEVSVDISLVTTSQPVIQASESIKDNPFLISVPRGAIDESEKISSMNVTVISKITKEKYPHFVISKLDSILAEYGATFKLHFEKITLEKKSQAKKEQGIASMSFFEKVVSVISLFSFITLVLYGVLSTFFGKKDGGSKQLIETITSSVDLLKNSLDSLISSNSQQAMARFDPISKPFSFEVNMGGDSYLKEFEIDSINELLMDCYWSEEDAYASFIWEKLDVTRKGKLLDLNMRMSEYVNYITTVESEDKGYIGESYYLNALALNSVTNENLTKVVMEYPSVFHLLPTVRISNLKMNATQKKNYMLKSFSKEDTENQLVSIKWEKFETTDVRKFDTVRTFRFESEEEEVQFFSEPNLDFSLITSFPSLAWLSFYRDEDIAEILSPFSAKELAIAWAGPRTFLDKLESVLPTKKKDLLISYQDKTIPSRDSAVFKEIMKRVSNKNEAVKVLRLHSNAA